MIAVAVVTADDDGTSAAAGVAALRAPWSPYCARGRVGHSGGLRALGAPRFARHAPRSPGTPAEADGLGHCHCHPHCLHRYRRLDLAACPDSEPSFVLAKALVQQRPSRSCPSYHYFQAPRRFPLAMRCACGGWPYSEQAKQGHGGKTTASVRRVCDAPVTLRSDASQTSCSAFADKA